MEVKFEEEVGLREVRCNFYAVSTSARHDGKR
jgi:hypothetical protein